MFCECCFCSCSSRCFARRASIWEGMPLAGDVGRGDMDPPRGDVRGDGTGRLLAPTPAPAPAPAALELLPAVAVSDSCGRPDVDFRGPRERPRCCCCCCCCWACFLSAAASSFSSSSSASRRHSVSATSDGPGAGADAVASAPVAAAGPALTRTMTRNEPRRTTSQCNGTDGRRPDEYRRPKHTTTRTHRNCTLLRLHRQTPSSTSSSPLETQVSPSWVQRHRRQH